MAESTDVWPCYYYAPTCLEGRVFATQAELDAARSEGPWTKSLLKRRRRRRKPRPLRCPPQTTKRHTHGAATVKEHHVWPNIRPTRLP